MNNEQTTMTATANELFGAAISTYSRAQAIEDGVLVCANSGDFDEVTRQHFKYPVAMTSAVFGLMEKAVNNENWMNDYKGVWHDICHMSRSFYRTVDATTRIFRVIIKGAGRKSIYDLKAVCGPGDDGEPVLTFMLPTED